jgi:Ca2+-binding RTX toxin-like protein
MGRGLVTLCLLLAFAAPAAAAGRDSIYVSQYGTMYFSGSDAVNRVTWTSMPDGTVLIADPNMMIRSEDVSGGDPCDHPAGWLAQCRDMSSQVSLSGGNDLFDAPRNSSSIGYYCCSHGLVVYGGDGNDTISGGYVSDFGASGGNGADTLVVGPNGSAHGGPGNDRIDVANGSGEGLVTCDAGDDVVLADEADTVPPDCERVIRAG